MKNYFMMTLVLGLFLAPSAQASKLFYCKYMVYDMAPFCDVSIGTSDGHQLDTFVTVIEQGGSVHKETATVMPSANGELFHLAISKESPDNTIYMIIYNKTDESNDEDTYKSVLINPSMPAAYQNVYGTCALQ